MQSCCDMRCLGEEKWRIFYTPYKNNVYVNLTQQMRLCMYILYPQSSRQRRRGGYALAQEGPRTPGSVGRARCI